MAGHNKWSKIKHKKAATDAQRSKVFGKLARLISVESKKCGGDTNSPSLRAAIDKAKAANMPSQNIERAIEKGGGADAENLEEVSYEGYGPGGCAIIVDTLTDNRNRTAAEIRHIFTKNSCSVGVPGSASWNFERSSDSVEAKTKVALSEANIVALERFVNELSEQDDVQTVYTNKE